MYSKKGAVYNLHAGWFINRPPGEFINWSLFIKFRGLLCGNPRERAESLILTPRAVDFTSISNFFELISPSGYIAVTLQEFKIIN